MPLGQDPQDAWKATEDSVRSVYEGVFAVEQSRLNGSQCGGAGAMSGPARIAVRCLALQVAAEALKEARTAGCVVLLVRELGPRMGQRRVELGCRYVDVAAGVAVEKLLAVQDAAVTGHELLRRFEYLCDLAEWDWEHDDVLYGVSGDPGSAAAEQFVKLLLERAAGPVTGPRWVRVWDSRHRLEQRVVVLARRACPEAEDFFATLSMLQDFFAPPSRLQVLKKYCPWMSETDLGTVDGAVRAFAVDPQRVVQAMEEVVEHDGAKILQETLELFQRMNNMLFLSILITYSNIFDATDPVSKLFSFSADCDGVEEVTRCLNELHDAGFSAKVKEDISNHGSIRFLSCLTLFKLIKSQIRIAKTAIEMCLTECRYPLMVRRLLQDEQDGLAASRQLHFYQIRDEDKQALWKDILLCREAGVAFRCPGDLSALLSLKDFPAKYPHLHAALVTLLTVPLLPCESRRQDEVLDDVQDEFVMILLSSTGWSGEPTQRKNVDGAIKMLAFELPDSQSTVKEF